VNLFSSAPFFRILPAFCLGVISSHYSLVAFGVICFISLLSIACYFFLHWRSVNDFHFRFYSGFVLQLVFIAAGFSLNEAHDSTNSDFYFEKFSNPSYYIAEIDNPAVVKGMNIRVVASIVAVSQNSRLCSSSGKCYIYFKNDPGFKGVYPGDKIIFTRQPELLIAPKNPGWFDFKKYSSLKRIFHKVNLNDGEWKLLAASGDFNIKKISVDLRDKFLDVYKRAGLEDRELAVLSALVLGYDDEIDQTVYQAFSASGTLHILSVSGMHVGIVFTALSMLLNVFEKSRRGRFIRISILLSSLWFYAMLTGLSSSVIRSAMMFSFILIGSSFNRTLNIYNSLSISALLIFLFFDPLLLFDTGLQLSFLAVAGIAYLYPRIYHLFYVRYFILDKAWALVAVSIAAQTATFPLSIFLFHQFPNYFIPANLLIIPLSTLGIFSGIFLLFISPFEFVFDNAGWLIQNLISFLNTSALWIEQLPGAVTAGITISFSVLVLLYFLMMAAVNYFEKLSFSALRIFLFSGILLLGSLTYYSIVRHYSKSILFFSNTREFSCQIRLGEQSWLLFSGIDSVRARKNSDLYGISVGLPSEKRILICLDSLSSPFRNGNVVISDKHIVVGKYSALYLSDHFSEKLLKQIKKVNLVYSKEVVQHLNKPGFLFADELIVNRPYLDSVSYNLRIQENPKLHFLKNECRLIEL
jgi:competence protein ComEC